MRISDWSSDVCSSDLVNGGVAQFQPAQLVFVAEHQAERRDAAVDQVGAEKVGAAGPGRIGDGHMFCAELDGNGIEIKLEIAAEAHGAFQAAAEHPFEGLLEEAALGDEEEDRKSTRLNSSH